MNLLRNIKKVFTKEAKNNEIPLIDLCIEKTKSEKIFHKNKPKEISEKEWESILNQILFAFKQIKRPPPRNPAKQKIVKNKIRSGFNLLESYIKNL